MIIQPLRIESGSFALRRAFSEAYQPVYQATQGMIYAVAMEIALREFVEYMSGVDTATFCKSCAYKWDKRGVRLCRHCRNGWHPHQQQACNAGLKGRAWVVCRRCGVNRHTDDYAMCYACNEQQFEVEFSYEDDAES